MPCRPKDDVMIARYSSGNGQNFRTISRLVTPNDLERLSWEESGINPMKDKILHADQFPR
ncbi:MAG: hypothetical protein K9M98_11850 [Cephaloticoccus sp.]|nr:hypothetical protein [Cephaloticoccus sp.]MCF7761186.1 hypothetical protein [Cephaloticoccus sp.]